MRTTNSVPGNLDNPTPGREMDFYLYVRNAAASGDWEEVSISLNQAAYDRLHKQFETKAITEARLTSGEYEFLLTCYPLGD